MFGLDWLVAPNTIAGPVVTPQTAMSVPAIAASVSLVASTIGSLPMRAYRRAQDGSREPAPDHPAHALVHGRANPHQSAGRLREQLALDVLLHGNAFAQAVRVNGRIAELWRLDPLSVAVEADPGTGEPRYRSNGTPAILYDPADLVHLRGPVSFDGLLGVSPIALHREAIGLAITLERHAARLFGRGAKPSGVLKFKGRLDATAADRIKASWSAAHAGEEAGRTAVLEDDADFQPLTFTSVDSQFLEQRQAQAYECARAFGVPPSMIGLVDRATWGNAETQNRQFLALTLRPMLRELRAEFERVLISDDDVFLDAITDDLIRPDTAARATAYAAFRSAGIYTANELRALENLPPRADGDSLASPFTTPGTGTPDTPDDDEAAE